MQLTLTRKWLSERATRGLLQDDTGWECYTLEDRVRAGEKVYGETAIPEGRYQVILSMSNRFKKRMPEILRVPGFEGIRIHRGRTAAHTEGCVLVGTEFDGETLSGSEQAYDELYTLLEEALPEDQVWIDIHTDPEVDTRATA